MAVRKWAHAMVRYSDLLKIVEPKEKKVAEMAEMLKVVRANLK